MSNILYFVYPQTRQEGEGISNTFMASQLAPNVPANNMAGDGYPCAFFLQYQGNTRRWIRTGSGFFPELLSTYLIDGAGFSKRINRLNKLD